MSKTFFLLLAVIISLTSYGNANRAIAISTKFLDRESCDNEIVLFSYKNSFNDEIRSINLTTYGEWIVIQTVSPLLLVFTRDWKLYPLYALPGDSIRVVCSISTGLEFLGNRYATDLNALNIIEREVGYLTPSLPGLKISSKLNFRFLADTLEAIATTRLKLLDSLYHNNTGGLYKVFKEMLHYRFMTDYLRPYWEQHEFELSKIVPTFYEQRCREFTNFVTSKIADGDGFFYRIFIANYNKFLSKTEKISVTRSSEPDNQELYETASRSFVGDSKDFLLFKYIKEGLIDKPQYRTDFFNSCKNKSYLRYIDSLITLKSKFNYDKEVLETALFSLNSTRHFKDFLKENNGKPVYIDFWASWCKPCIQEFKPLMELEKKFGDQISFVSISIDHKRDAWLNAIDRYLLPKDRQLLMDRKSALGKYIALEAIPRFILIGANGQLITEYAPRPSHSKELIKLIGQVLKQ